MPKITSIRGILMYKKLYNALYIMNIVLQGFWCLLFPVGIGFGLCWLLVEHAGLPGWTYAVGITLGVFVGLISMCRFLISATEAMERLEKSKAAERVKRPRIAAKPLGENDKEIATKPLGNSDKEE